MEEVLKHPLGPLPAALATENGLPRKTNKAQLGRQLEKLVQPAEDIPRPFAYLIDGMAPPEVKEVDNLTFGETADTTLSRVLREGVGSSEIDVVPTCIEGCLSNQPREPEKRSQGETITFRNL